MKSTELMIGDWVYDTMNGNEIPCKVSIDDFKEESEVMHPFSVFEPITLTEEILKANGWISTDGYSFHYDWLTLLTDKIALGFSIYINGRGLMLKYIHELQHALRLCGLTDLADNFKIEQI